MLQKEVYVYVCDCVRACVGYTTTINTPLVAVVTVCVCVRFVGITF